MAISSVALVDVGRTLHLRPTGSSRSAEHDYQWEKNGNPLNAVPELRVYEDNTQLRPNESLCFLKQTGTPQNGQH